MHLIWQVFIDGRHEFAPVMPRRKVGKVLPDEGLCCVTFCLDEGFDNLSGSLAKSQGDFLLVELDCPKTIVPAVEVALIKL
jgi:hypothetical protein